MHSLVSSFSKLASTFAIPPNQKVEPFDPGRSILFHLVAVALTDAYSRLLGTRSATFLHP